MEAVWPDIALEKALEQDTQHAADPDSDGSMKCQHLIASVIKLFEPTCTRQPPRIYLAFEEAGIAVDFQRR